MIVYTVTVLDLVGNPILGDRRTPVIFTDLAKAISAIKNNDHDLADSALYQYAVIEETYLNVIRPDLLYDIKQLWFKYSPVMDEFVECRAEDIPSSISRLSGFGIG
jgi:hypothetical protein